MQFAVDFSDRSSCLEFMEESLGGFGLPLPRDAEVRLELAAGTDMQGVKVYRPYVLMASILGRAKNDKHANQVGNIKLRDADKSIADWRAEQAGIDEALSLKLPPGASLGTPSRQIFSGSVPTRVVF